MAYLDLLDLSIEDWRIVMVRRSSRSTMLLHDEISTFLVKWLTASFMAVRLWMPQYICVISLLRSCKPVRWNSFASYSMARELCRPQSSGCSSFSWEGSLNLGGVSVMIAADIVKLDQ